MLLGGRLESFKATLLKVFVLLLPTQLGYHFWPQWAYVFGIRIDYLSPTFYLTDILAGLIVSVWLFEKRKKIDLARTFLLFLPLVLLILLNIISAEVVQVAFIKWVKVLELILVAFVVFRDKNLDVKKTIMRPLAIAAIFVFLISLFQLILQGSIGGFLYFLGERTFNSGTPGISLYTILGRSLLRPYSTFSHPNSMAGFAGVAFLLLAGLGKKYKEKGPILYSGMAACLGALFLSGSKAAMAALILVAGLYLLGRKRKKLYGKVLPLAAVLVVLGSMLLPFFANKALRGGTNFSERVGQRLVLADIAGRLYSQRPLVGLGLNNFIPGAAGLKSIDFYFWALQPVHNVPLLVLIETGIVGFMISVWFFFKLVKKAKDAPVFVGLAIIFVLVTASVDHYWLTLQQNQLLLAVFMGLIFRQNKKGFLLN